MKTIYAWNKVNPTLCYGRDELRGELLKKLPFGSSFGIAGGRRMGKTTLLRRVEMELKSEEETLPRLVGKAYDIASGMTHTSAKRDQAYQALKQWDALLSYLTARSTR